MCALFRDNSVSKHKNDVAVEYCPQAVSNKEACTSFLFQDAVNVLHDVLLGVGVQRAGRFIEK